VRKTESYTAKIASHHRLGCAGCLGAGVKQRKQPRRLFLRAASFSLDFRLRRRHTHATGGVESASAFDRPSDSRRGCGEFLKANLVVERERRRCRLEPVHIRVDLW
jgi:hypothetical protein